MKSKAVKQKTPEQILREEDAQPTPNVE